MVLVALSVSVQTSPALADKYLAVTPSGTNEMLFPDPPQTVIGELASKCIDVRWTVTSSTSNGLVCEVPLNMGQSILGQLLLGNSYSTPPREFIRFNVAEVNGISRVQGSGWMELQMAFGQIKRTDFSGATFANNLMTFLGAAGGKYPVGTTFPNHAILGVNGENVQQGKLVSFRITEILPNSPASKAGLQVGDIVTRIAGKQFKNTGDYLDATAKAAEKPTYEVEFVRGGNTSKVSVERAFRPTWTETVVPAVAQAAPTPPSAPASVADELQKLLNLKEAGALTDAEFEAEKKKLLGN